MRGGDTGDWRQTALVQGQATLCSPHALGQQKEWWAQTGQGSVALGFRESFALVDEFTHRDKLPWWGSSGVDSIHRGLFKNNLAEHLPKNGLCAVEYAGGPVPAGLPPFRTGETSNLPGHPALPTRCRLHGGCSRLCPSVLCKERRCMSKYSKVMASSHFHAVCLAVSSLRRFLPGHCSLPKNPREMLPRIDKQSSGLASLCSEPAWTRHLLVP